MKRLRVVSPIVFLLIAAPGCDKDQPPPATSRPAAVPTGEGDVQAMREFLRKDSVADPPKPAPPSPAPSPRTQIAPPNASASDAITFQAPAGWVSQPPTSAMRKAQYKLPAAAPDQGDAELIVFFFGPGQGGGVDQNIARWKGMFSTAEGKPVADSAIRQTSSEVDGMKVTMLDISGRYVDPMAAGHSTPSPQQDSRMLAAIVETPQGLWFFKAVGPQATIGAHEENFKGFVASVKKK